MRRSFAERVFEQIRGFGEYGFPESHAASFALISYASAWLKCHYPAEFTCALLNAQPMGFYSPATIIEDAKCHGIEVRPASALSSDWDCTLEALGDAQGFAVRIGLRYLKGLGRGDFDRIAAARCAASFSSVEDLAGRTGLDRGTLSTLAEAGALEGLAPPRREALWQALGTAGERPAPLAVGVREGSMDFRKLSEFQTVLWDYRTQGHSVRSHPLATVRKELRALGLPTAREVICRPPRPPYTLRGPGHLPPAARDGQGGDLSHPGRRDGLRQRGGVAAGLCKAHGPAPDRHFFGGHRHDAGGGGGGPSGGPDPLDSKGPPWRSLRPEPGLPLNLSPGWASIPKSKATQKTTCSDGYDTTKETEVDPLICPNAGELCRSSASSRSRRSSKPS